MGEGEGVRVNHHPFSGCHCAGAQCPKQSPASAANMSKRISLVLDGDCLTTPDNDDLNVIVGKIVVALRLFNRTLANCFNSLNYLIS